MAALGTVLGLLPHVLHHIGLIAGTATLVGTGGASLFGAVGLVASVPMLLRHGWSYPRRSRVSIA